MAGPGWSGWFPGSRHEQQSGYRGYTANAVGKLTTIGCTLAFFTTSGSLDSDIPHSVSVASLVSLQPRNFSFYALASLLLILA